MFDLFITWYVFVVANYRKTSMVRQASMDQVHKPYTLVRQQSIHEAEAEQCYLAPKIDQRIFQYNDEVRLQG